MASKYGFGKTVACAFDEAIERVTAALQTEGGSVALIFSNTLFTLYVGCHGRNNTADSGKFR